MARACGSFPTVHDAANQSRNFSGYLVASNQHPETNFTSNKTIIPESHQSVSSKEWELLTNMGTGPVYSYLDQIEPRDSMTTPPAASDGNGESSDGLPLIDVVEGVQAAAGEWFALVVKPRFDKAVGRMLEAKGYETLVPTYRKYRMYGARSKASEMPLFPGYVCCRFDVRRSLPILSTPGVVRVVGTQRVPMPLSEVEINALQAAMKAHIPVHPFPFVSAGQRVRITGGALAGIEGIVLGPKPKLRIVLSITLLQRSVLLEIDQDQVCAEGAVNVTALYETSGVQR